MKTANSSNRWQDAAFAGVVVGATTFLVDILADALLTDWPRSRRGAVVAGWIFFSMCTVFLWQRRRRNGYEPPSGA